ncbi:MAG: acyl-CoA thioesterase [Ignavibacteriae bacterium]|nr:acyl-CoA thioesterase [Ignavibacteria bacterium]MBI3364923.1 acyl-CoA thioesterase [Ignavibacteriota bacterium]
MRVFEHRHIVTFEETNLLGNVYFTNFFLWQGECREMFLHEHVPEVLIELKDGISLATTRSNCEFFSEAFAFDEILVRLKLLELTQSRITMGFEYVRMNNDRSELIARGEQQVVCIRKNGHSVAVEELPPALHRKLLEFQQQS